GLFQLLPEAAALGQGQRKASHQGREVLPAGQAPRCEQRIVQGQDLTEVKRHFLSPPLPNTETAGLSRRRHLAPLAATQNKAAKRGDNPRRLRMSAKQLRKTIRLIKRYEAGDRSPDLLQALNE